LLLDQNEYSKIGEEFDHQNQNKKSQ